MSHGYVSYVSAGDFSDYLSWNLVYNGGFDSDTNWNKTNASISGGVATLSASATLIGTGVPTVGQTYRIKYDVIAVTGPGVVAYAGSTGAGTLRVTPGTYTEDIVCAGATAFYFFTGGAATATIDNCQIWWLSGGIEQYPNVAGDTFLVNANHTISVDVYSTVELGASTVNGTLRHKAGGVRRLLFNHNDLTIGTTGNLGGGYTVSNGDAFILEWNTTVDNVKGILNSASGMISLSGDSNFYGNIYETTLVSTWNSGRTLTISGDVTTAWANEILGPELVTNGSFTTDLSGWSGTNWAWESDGAGGGWARKSGATGDYITGPNMPTAYGIYKITITIGGATGGSWTLIPRFGATNTGHSLTSNGTYTLYAIGAATGVGGALNFAPNTFFNGYIDDISCKEVISGREILIHKNYAYSNYSTDAQRYSIHELSLSGSNTIITIGEPAPSLTFYSGAVVINPSRNVILQKVNPSKTNASYNALRPLLTLQNTSKINVSNVSFVGYRFAGTNSPINILDKCVIRNHGTPITSYGYCTIKNSIFFGNSSVLLSVINMNLDNCIFLGNYAMYTIYDSRITNNKFLTLFSISFDENTVVSNNIFNGNNNAIIGPAQNVKLINNTFINNTTTLGYSYAGSGTIPDCLVNPILSTYTFGSRGVLAYKGKYKTDCYDNILENHRTFEAFITIRKSNEILRENNIDTINVYPLSYIDNTFYPTYPDQSEYGQKIFTWIENNVPIGNHDRSVKIKGLGNILENSNFNTDTVWTKSAGWTISGGKATCTNANFSMLYQNPFTLTTTKQYKAYINVLSDSGDVGSKVTLENTTLISSIQGTQSQTTTRILLGLGINEFIYRHDSGVYATIRSGFTSAGATVVIEEAYIYPVNTVSNNNVYFEAEYYNQDGTTSKIKSTTTLTNQDDWFDFPVNFNQGKVGKVIYTLYINKYIGLTVDNVLYRGKIKPLYPSWVDGESKLIADYSYETSNKYSLRGRRIYG